MIIVDTCIISSLSKTGNLELLRSFKDVCTSPGVVREISNSGNPALIEPLSTALAGWLAVRAVRRLEMLSKLQERYPALGHVDCELMLLCEEHDAVLLSDDTALITHAENSFGIKTFDLCDILDVLRKKGKIGDGKLDVLISDLEKKDRYKFSREALRRLGR